MIRLNGLIVGVLACSGLASAGGGDRPYSLMVGDAAPKLVIGEWIKGQPFDSFHPGQVYVVEFWATWCSPCVAGMAHLSELQDKYRGKGVTIVGVTKPDHDNTAAAVRKLAEKRQVTYAVAMDDGRTTFDAWMTAAGQKEIPCAFIVDRAGRIAAVLKPDQTELEQPLSAIVNGSWDLEAESKAYAARMGKYAQAEPIYKRFADARDAKSWSEAVVALDDLIAVDPGLFASYAGNKFRIMLQELKQTDQAYAFARSAMNSFARDSAEALGFIAFAIVNPKADVERRDLDLAMTAATRANELTKGEMPDVLAVLARTYAWKKDFAKAVELSRRAVERAPEGDQPFYREALAEYEKAGG